MNSEGNYLRFGPIVVCIGLSYLNERALTTPIVLRFEHTTRVYVVYRYRAWPVDANQRAPLRFFTVKWLGCDAN
jgi:hypothetical protein